MEMAQLMWDIGPDLGDGEPDRRLAVADHAVDRDPEGSQIRRDLAQQAGQFVTGRRQQGASQQDQPRQATADDPQHLVANIGLKTIDRQNDPALALQHRAMRRRPGRSGDQFVVALEQDATLADRHAAPAQLPMDLRDAAMLAIAQGAGQRDHVHHAAAAPGLLPLPAAMPDGIAHSSGSHSAGSSGAPGPIPAATRWPDGCCSGSASPGRIPDRHTGAEPGFARPPALLGTRTVTSPAPRSTPPDSLNRQPVLPFLKKSPADQ